MNFVDIIIKKRNNIELNSEELSYFIEKVSTNELPDYQVSALLMAIAINSLNKRETADLTKYMTYYGDTLDLSEIAGIKVDKHSTGGVGDATTLILAPLVASLGLPIIKMSGRGLGHTGGTLDKLESIPGFNINMQKSSAFNQANNEKLVIMGQTDKLVPADKYLYALRDVTGTVESIPLIASSIMSKKLAGGADAIVLDVKIGNGAFMQDIKNATELATTMIDIGKSFDKKVSALITDMNEPLGLYIGNSLEVIEAIETLKGNSKGRLKDVSIKLGTQMLMLGGIAKDEKEAESLLETNIKNGKGLDKFIRLIELQGGNANVVNDYSLLGKAKEIKYLKANEAGFINAINAYEIGRASLATGAGRLTKHDSIDYNAGIIMHKKVTDYVEKGEVLAEIHANSEDKCSLAIGIINNAIKISSTKPAKRQLIYNIIN